ncbi:uncharacterized protein LOC127832586 isoform X2 [Dreissena polymorpha]|uniref:uncharacterized protein LOC127832586 isoform X2 n=1 Tax=Dreissena polymorpha TaxID=45954 RepID=UPI002263CFB2|nr:uncharacterized protein LOC127832586 isoform X2 [Dreissena polymorpha]
MYVNKGSNGAGQLVFMHYVTARTVAVVHCATTVTMPTDMSTTAAPMTTTKPPTVLFDMKSHKAMVVAADGCYEYHMNHQDTLDHANNLAALTQRIIDAWTARKNTQETGHHHIDHMTPEITTACASLPVYSFD